MNCTPNRILPVVSVILLLFVAIAIVGCITQATVDIVPGGFAGKKAIHEQYIDGNTTATGVDVDDEVLRDHLTQGVLNMDNFKLTHPELRFLDMISKANPRGKIAMHVYEGSASNYVLVVFNVTDALDNFTGEYHDLDIAMVLFAGKSTFTDYYIDYAALDGKDVLSTYPEVQFTSTPTRLTVNPAKLVIYS